MFEGQGRGDVLIRVAVDTMGGDFGPPEAVKGALEGLDTHNIELLLVGDQNLLESELARYDIKNKPVKVVASVGKIGDDEHPIEGLRRKPKSSIVVATKLLKSGDADLLVSMGSTGASMARLWPVCASNRVATCCLISSGSTTRLSTPTAITPSSTSPRTMPNIHFTTFMILLRSSIP
jgi:hypothetical protein